MTKILLVKKIIRLQSTSQLRTQRQVKLAFKVCGVQGCKVDWIVDVYIDDITRAKVSIPLLIQNFNRIVRKRMLIFHKKWNKTIYTRGMSVESSHRQFRNNHFQPIIIISKKILEKANSWAQMRYIVRRQMEILKLSVMTSEYPAVIN